MSNDNNDLILAEITKTVVTLDRAMEAMYMLEMRHDEVLLERGNLQVSKHARGQGIQ